MPALSKQERAELARLERVIEGGLEGFRKAGEALARIKEGKLYRDDHKDFRDYLRKRWDLGKTHAYQLIAAADVADDVSAVADVEPQTERQIRPLAGLDEEGRKEAWEKAVEAAGGGQPTAEQVEEAAEEVKLERLTNEAIAELPAEAQLRLFDDESKRIQARARQRQDRARRDGQRDLHEGMRRDHAKLRKKARRSEGDVDHYLSVLDQLDRALDRLEQAA